MKCMEIMLLEAILHQLNQTLGSANPMLTHCLPDLLLAGVCSSTACAWMISQWLAAVAFCFQSYLAASIQTLELQLCHA